MLCGILGCLSFLQPPSHSGKSYHRTGYLLPKAEQLPKLPPSPHRSNPYMYLFFDSQPYLGKLKEFNNKGIKKYKQYRFQNLLFFVTEKKEERLRMKFSSTQIQVCYRFLNPYFKINTPLFRYSPFLKEYLNPQKPQARINKMVNKHSVDYHASLSDCNEIPSYSFRFTIKGTYSRVFIDPLGIYFFIPISFHLYLQML